VQALHESCRPTWKWGRSGLKTVPRRYGHGSHEGGRAQERSHDGCEAQHVVASAKRAFAPCTSWMFRHSICPVSHLAALRRKSIAMAHVHVVTFSMRVCGSRRGDMHDCLSTELVAMAITYLTCI
jgi:hypothetical protein